MSPGFIARVNEDGLLLRCLTEVVKPVLGHRTAVVRVASLKN